MSEPVAVAHDEAAAAPDRVAWRFRLVACSLALTAFAFLQQPGRVVADTKLDLVVDPGGFLARALTMWDPEGAFGQVQNQAYGYLFPMGPVFWLAHLLGTQPWVVQRLWWALLLVVAFLGTVKLASSLGVGSPFSRVLAGFAYALSPRILSVVGPSSIEVWPMALAPWVLVPLVVGLRRGDPRRMAALSALAVACVGGVNAAATFAVIPLGAIWLLFQPPSARRRALMLWWPAFTLLGTLWWLLPLFLLGRYSPPFLDYIESASTTTSFATVLDALRGTAQWVPYIDPFSSAGRALVEQPVLILNGVVVLALGVVGLARRDLPHRRFLVLGLLAGLVMVTLGHTGAPSGLGSATVSSLLDGALAPLRNTHKFDVLLRLPLVLGLAHLLGRRTVRVAGGRRDTLAVATAFLAVASLVGATAPAWSGQLANRATFSDVPAYWTQTADWLGEQDDGRRTLVVPSAAFGSYLWGRTGDEVLQPLAEAPWAVRNAIPLAEGGNIQTLDAIERRLVTGRGSAGLTDYLRRAGIGRLVVTNDRAVTTDQPSIELTRATLLTSPGISRAAAFGPRLGGGPALTNAAGQRVFVDSGWQTYRRAVEVFEVDDVRRGRARTHDLSQTPVVVGGPESLLTLDDLGLTSGAPTVLGSDVPAGTVPRQWVLTDGQPRREASFGRVDANRSATLSPDQPYGADRPVHDYVVSPGGDRWKSVPRLEGADAVRASTSQAYVGALGAIDPSAQPWSAFDGDPLTTWRASAADDGRGAWAEIDLGEPRRLQRVVVTSGADRGEVGRAQVTTDAGSVAVDLRGGQAVEVALPPGSTRSLRITGPSTFGRPFSLTDVELDGVSVSRPLRLPRTPTAWGAPDRVVLTADDGYASGCLRIAGILRCVPAAASVGEDGRTIDRELTLGAARSYPVSLEVEGLGGPALDRLLQQDKLTAVEATSQATGSPLASVLHVADRDNRTGWVAAADDLDPTITVRFAAERTVSRVRVTTSPLLPATVPTSAVLRFPDGQSREVELEDGRASFEPVRASSVEVHLPPEAVQPNLDTDGSGGRLPVGVSEIGLGRGFFPQVASEDVRTYPCGTGPLVTVGGRTYPTSVTASPAALLRGERARADLCGAGAVVLAAGEQRVTVRGNDAFRPVSAVLGDGGRLDTDPGRAAGIDRWGSTSREVRPPESGDAQLLAVPENDNAGWVAASGSDALRAVRVDGWQQGWVVPADTRDAVRLDFEPGTTYRVGLLLGLVTAIALLLAPVVLRRSSRSPRRSRRDRRPGPALLGGGVTVVAGLVAGPWGLLAAVAGLVGGHLVRRRGGEDAVPWVAGLLLVLAGLAYVARPWGGAAGWAGDFWWPQVLAVVALGLVTSAAGLPRRRSLRRRNGLSTSR